MFLPCAPTYTILFFYTEWLPSQYALPLSHFLPFPLIHPNFHRIRKNITHRFLLLTSRVVIPGVRRPFGGRTCPLRLIWIGRGTIDREITVPNLLYCSNFSYYFPPTWSRGGWQFEVAAHGSVPAPVWPFYLPWAVSQCPFDPYRAGAKVYRAYRAGGPPHRQPCSHLYIIQQFTFHVTTSCAEHSRAQILYGIFLNFLLFDNMSYHTI
jgi:hypothetical protein